MSEIKRYSPAYVEERIANWWRENNIIEKVMNKNKGAPIFSFLEGPPTVNGFMHIGHTRGRVYKDIILRYMTMRGLDVWRRAGWDCQGLPTEIEVEKRLNIKTKKDLERIGLERFIEEANKVVDYYISQWRSASERLALWLDYDNAYETRREEYMEHVWYLLKKAYEDGNLIESLRVVPYCPRCETPLSQHELAQGYEEVKDPSIYVKMPLEGSDNRYVIIWTTTPWTLPGNEAIAIDPEAEYVELEVDGERWIIAHLLLQKFVEEVGLKKHRKLSVFKGEKLVGMKYVHPLEDEVPAHKSHDGTAHTVVSSEFVSMEEGTGCVHTAPAHGPEDFELGKRNNLPIFCPVSSTGVFTTEGGKYNGLTTRDASKVIIDDLERKNLLVKAGEIIHNYPLCWRCGTPLIYLASTQWFLRVEPIKQYMIEGNENVVWWPEWAGTNRFGEWLKNAEDWCISRTKVWGTPLNVWTCQNCGKKRVVGSRAELNEAIEKPNELRMHRPWIDQVVFKCNECGGKMYRVPYVLDTWLDSGVAHIASIDYLRNRELFEKLFPYDFITEAIDQTRGWFYTLLFTSTLLFKKPPFKSVLNQGHVLDEFGKKMSKSRGNVLWAHDAFDRFGVDPVRLYLVSKAEPWSTINFVPSELTQVIEQLNTLWNVFLFAKTYFELDKFNPERHNVESLSRDLKPEDKWLLSKVNTLIKIVTKSLDEREIQDAAREIRRFFIEDLSRTYIRSIRRRVWVEEQTREKLAAYATLYYALRVVTILLAPFTPHLAEVFFKEIRKADDPESVHMVSWPKPDERYIDEELEDYMDIVQDTLTAVLAGRQKGDRKLRWPVSRIIVSPKTQRAKQALSRYADFLKTLANAHNLELLDVNDKPRETMLRVKPDFRRLGPKLGKKLTQVAQALSSVDGYEVKKEVEKNGRYSLLLPDKSEVKLESDDLIFEEELPANLVFSEGRFAFVYIDLIETDEIRRLAIANEFIRRIQVMRKEMNLNILDEIDCLIIVQNGEVTEQLKAASEYIEEETRTRLQIHGKHQDIPSDYFGKSWKIGALDVTIALRKPQNNT